MTTFGNAKWGCPILHYNSYVHAQYMSTKSHYISCIHGHMYNYLRTHIQLNRLCLQRSNEEKSLAIEESATASKYIPRVLQLTRKYFQCLPLEIRSSDISSFFLCSAPKIDRHYQCVILGALHKTLLQKE